MKIDYDYLREYFSKLTLNKYCGSTYLYYTARLISETGEEKASSCYLPLSESHVCFGSLISNFNLLRGKASEQDKIEIQIFVSKKCNGRNKIFTWMNTEELKQFILDFTNLFSDNLHVLDVRVEEGRDKDTLKINILVPPILTTLEQKLILFWVRNAIKWPYNLLLASAITLKNDYYPQEHLYNLLSVVIFGSRWYTSTTSTLDENWSCWGPLITPEYIEKGKQIKQYTLIGLNNNGILPHISYGEYSMYLPKYETIREELIKDVSFRQDIRDKLVKFTRTGSEEAIYDPVGFLNNKSQFELYREIYEFKQTLKPLYM